MNKKLGKGLEKKDDHVKSSSKKTNVLATLGLIATLLTAPACSNKTTESNSNNSQNNTKTEIAVKESIVLDENTFQLINDQFGKDNTHVFYHNIRQLYKIDDRGGYETDSYDDRDPIDGGDPKSFELIGSTSQASYTKDKTNVYVIYLDGDGKYYEYGSRRTVLKKIEGADPESFKIINEDYAKDNNEVYKLGKIVEGADPESFKIINRDYTKDKNHVFYRGELVDGADPKSFASIYENYAKDKNHIFHHGKVAKGSNPSLKSKTLKDEYDKADDLFLINGNDFYYAEHHIPGVDKKTFKYFNVGEDGAGWINAEDKNYEYFLPYGSHVEGGRWFDDGRDNISRRSKKNLDIEQDLVNGSRVSLVAQE